MTTPQKPKGLCPDCKVMVVLSADGTIRHHDRKVLNPHPTPQGLPADHGFLYHVLAKCPGGRKKPEQNTRKELCPDGVTEKEFDPERSSQPEKTEVPAPKYCDPEE